jgi:hypothetical protein
MPNSGPRASSCVGMCIVNEPTRPRRCSPAFRTSIRSRQSWRPARRTGRLALRTSSSAMGSPARAQGSALAAARPGPRARGGRGQRDTEAPVAASRGAAARRAAARCCGAAGHAGAAGASAPAYAAALRVAPARCARHGASGLCGRQGGAARRRQPGQGRRGNARRGAPAQSGRHWPSAAAQCARPERAAERGGGHPRGRRPLADHAPAGAARADRGQRRARPLGARVRRGRAGASLRCRPEAT